MSECRDRHAGAGYLAEPGDRIGALRADSLLAVPVGQRGHVVGVRRHDRAELGDPIDLLGGGEPEVHDRRAVVLARVARLAGLEGVQDQVQAGVAVLVDVDLVAGVPVGGERAGEYVRLDHPLALVAVEVAVPHLHRLAEDRPVGEQLDLLGQE
jgi:hypothetical protein